MLLATKNRIIPTENYPAASLSAQNTDEVEWNRNEASALTGSRVTAWFIEQAEYEDELQTFIACSSSELNWNRLHEFNIEHFGLKLKELPAIHCVSSTLNTGPYELWNIKRLSVTSGR